MTSDPDDLAASFEVRSYRTILSPDTWDARRRRQNFPDSFPIALAVDVAVVVVGHSTCRMGSSPRRPPARTALERTEEEEEEEE